MQPGFQLHAGSYCLYRNHTIRALDHKATINWEWEEKQHLHSQMPHLSFCFLHGYSFGLNSQVTSLPAGPLSWQSRKRVNFADWHLDLGSNSAYWLHDSYKLLNPWKTGKVNRLPQGWGGEFPYTVPGSESISIRYEPFWFSSHFAFTYSIKTVYSFPGIVSRHHIFCLGLS